MKFIISLFSLLILTSGAAQSLKFGTRQHQPESFIFTAEQRQFIYDNNLNNVLSHLFLHKVIVLHDPVLLIDFALEIKNSDLPFVSLEPRIESYIRNGLLPFVALEKAIDRERNKQWRIKKLKALNDNNDPFLRNIKRLQLKSPHQGKIYNAYAVCINTFRNKEDRRRWLTPNICEPIEGFEKLRFDPQHMPAISKARKKYSKKSIAYQRLLEESALVAHQYKLSDFEKIKMAKCISEQSLHFFSLFAKPAKAVKRSCQTYQQSPEKAFFAREGLCGNFSAIAYNVAIALGMQGRIYLARRHLHFYLEFESKGRWYHAHPFNSTANSCDIVKF